MTLLVGGDCRSLSELPTLQQTRPEELRTIKEFTTALKAVTEDDELPMVFSIDGHELAAYKPTDGQLAILMSSIGRHTNIQTQVAGIIDFFVAVMDEQSATYVSDRLLSRADPLGIEQVQEVMEWMVEEWTGRPTPPLSVSTQ